MTTEPTPTPTDPIDFTPVTRSLPDVPPLMEFTTIVLDAVATIDKPVFTTNDVIAVPQVSEWLEGHGLDVPAQRIRVGRVLQGYTAVDAGITKLQRKRMGESTWRQVDVQRLAGTQEPEPEPEPGYPLTDPEHRFHRRSVESESIPEPEPQPMLGVVAPPTLSEIVAVSEGNPELADVLEIVGKVGDAYIIRDTKGQLFGLRPIELRVL